MKVLKSSKKGNVNSLEVEVSQDELEVSMRKVYKDLKKSVSLAGFRKGSVPYSLFLKHYGKEYLIKDAVSDAVNTAYMGAVKELDLKIIDQPKNVDIKEYKEDQPIQFSCDVEVIPDVKLGKYKGVKVTKEVKEITDKVVQEEIDKIRDRYANYEAVERASANGDVIECTIEATLDEKVFEPWSRKGMVIKLGESWFGEKFDTELANKKAGDKASFSVDYDDKFAQKEVQNKSVAFNVELTAVKDKVLPEFTDEWVKQNLQVDTAKAFTDRMTEDMTNSAKQESEDKLKNDILEAVAGDIKVDLPNVLVENQINYLVQQFESQLKQSGFDLKRYLEFQKKEEATLRDEYRETAEKQVKVDLALEEIAKKESIDADDADMTAEVKKWNMPKVQTDEEIEKYLKKVDSIQLKSMIKKRKVTDFLVESAKIK